MIRTLAPLAGLFIAMLSALPLAAEITYAGEDAERLKCATMLSLASNFARGSGRLSPQQEEMSSASVAHLLDSLPGNGDEKGRAMQAMADRIMAGSTPESLKAEFEKTLPDCGRFF